MPYAPQPPVVILFPDAGSPGTAGRGKLPEWQRSRKNQRQPHWLPQLIPFRHHVDRIRRISDQAKRHLAEHKSHGSRARLLPQVDGSMRRLLHAFVILLAFGGTAWADDWADCQSNDFDRAIRGCTNIITSGRASPDNLAVAFLNRGNAYNFGKSNYERAITDYDKVIRLIPEASAGEAHYDRGEAYAKLGNAGKALEDLRIAARSIREGNPRRGEALKEVSKIEEQFAADRAKAVTQSAASAVAAPVPTRRFALVIGNSAYRSVSPLKNPRNDADLVAKTLRSLGFEVTELVDGDYNAMRQAIIDFGRALRSGSDASVFYYSGHGIQFSGHNYLVPVDAALKDEQEAGIETFDMDSYLGVMPRWLKHSRHSPHPPGRARGSARESREIVPFWPPAAETFPFSPHSPSLGVASGNVGNVENVLVARVRDKN
jgi:tetratricopeptide (TPR) repeat protein